MNHIDVIIPAHEKDITTLELCIKGATENVEGVQNVYVISKDKLTDNAIWYPEADLPFSLKDVAAKIGSHWRTSWYYADILEGCASIYVDGPSEYILILDADTIFLRPTALIEAAREDMSGPRALLNLRPSDGTGPYYEYVRNVIPGLQRQHCHSGVTHWILQEKLIVKKMVADVERVHGKKFWEAALDVTLRPYKSLKKWGPADHETCPGKMANFELYFTYVLQKYPERARVSKKKSILAYKGPLGVPGFPRAHEVSRTNAGRGKVQVINEEDESKMKEMNFSCLPDAIAHICNVCADKGWDTITFQGHTWQEIDDYHKLNDDYIKDIV